MFPVVSGFAIQIATVVYSIPSSVHSSTNRLKPILVNNLAADCPERHS